MPGDMPNQKLDRKRYKVVKESEEIYTLAELQATLDSIERDLAYHQAKKDKLLALKVEMLAAGIELE